MLGFCREDHFPPFRSFWVENNFTVWEWQVEVINHIANAMLTIFEQSQTTPEIASHVMTQAVTAINGLLRVSSLSCILEIFPTSPPPWSDHHPSFPLPSPPRSRATVSTQA